MMKQHYIVILILPILFVFNWMTIDVLRIENQYSVIAQILVYIDEGIFGLFVVFSIVALFRRKYKESFHILVSPIIVIIIIFVLLNKYGIDRDMIYYHFNKDKYLSVIEKSLSIATDGKGKLVQIPMGGSYLGCDKYLIYDATDEMANPKGNFRGVNYVTVHNSITNKTYKEKAYRIIVNSVDRHIFVAYFCATNGQENI